MNCNPFLLTVLCIALLVLSFLAMKLWRVYGQLSIIREVLEDMKTGNLNRRALARDSDMTKGICISLNEMAMKNQLQLIRQKQSEQAYKHLMTSLSHDMKTPLASLVGYLEAIENGLVTGEEKETYIHVATEKAFQLRHFVESLFEWVKLDAREQVFRFEQHDLNELTRNIVADWIPVLESNCFEYDIEIPETEYIIWLDPQAYTRILNNLFQNALTHSGGNKLSVQLIENSQQVKIIVSDNGNGISSADLPHIFERMYQCDHSRFAKGNGLGLSIARELVNAHKGKIRAESNSQMGTTFIISLPKAL